MGPGTAAATGLLGHPRRHTGGEAIAVCASYGFHIHGGDRTTTLRLGRASTGKYSPMPTETCTELEYFKTIFQCASCGFRGWGGWAAGLDPRVDKGVNLEVLFTILMGFSMDKAAIKHSLNC